MIAPDPCWRRLLLRGHARWCRPGRAAQLYLLFWICFGLAVATLAR